MELPRLFTAMITPFDQDLKVNYEKAVEMADYLCDNGSGGIIISGTTGESPVLTSEEKLQLFTVLKKAVGSKMSVWAGTGSNDTAHVAAFSREAEKTGVDGILVVAPYYSRPPQEGLYQHFKKIAEAVSIPVMVYNIPSRTGVNVVPETMKRLFAIDNIIAVKESSGDLDQVSILKNMIKDNKYIFSGDDNLTLPMLSLGAYGVVSVVSHVAGLEIESMIKAYVAGDVQKAQNLHTKLFALFKGLFIATNPLPVKTALNLMGFGVGEFRLPLVNMDEEQRTFLYNLLKSHGKLD
ncbi:MAG: 4-hydroxy-tetrahydrodipicolinate synthase [Syntrophomonadaceae bacterium]|jgi:4-hydroxy-tetrahydrodipicolinate synthase|nr:4-hydroxy-tetrahydrodipicolinate synthase [Syntrophomonadaceae bacterium]